MAKLTILGRDFEIAPYKLASMRRAAPFIDRINATAGSMTTLEGLTNAAGDFIAVLSIGLVKLDPELTPEMLEEELGIGDLAVMRDAFTAVMKESGLAAGEVPAPVASEAAGASSTNSGKSSTTSSPPASRAARNVRSSKIGT